MQMMVNIIRNIFGVGAQKLCASTLCSPHLQNVLSVLGESNTTTIGLETLFTPVVELGEGIGGLIISWFYFISRFIFQIVDLVQYLVYMVL